MKNDTVKKRICHRNEMFGKHTVATVIQKHTEVEVKTCWTVFGGRFYRKRSCGKVMSSQVSVSSQEGDHVTIAIMHWTSLYKAPLWT